MFKKNNSLSFSEGSPANLLLVGDIIFIKIKLNFNNL